MKKKWIMLALLLLAVCVLPLAAIADNPALPSSLKIIRTKAFYGDVSLNAVQLPERIERIESLAFANSTVREINLPSSLTYIADDAFANTPLQTVRAEAGTYAYQWAVDHGYLRHEEIYVTYQGTEMLREVNFVATNQWTVSSSSPWITIGTNESDTSGFADRVSGQNSEDGENTVYLLLGNNPSTTKTRTGYVAFSCGDASYNLPVYQRATSFQVTQNDETLTISANCRWTVETDCDWITPSSTVGVGNATVTLTVEENTSYTEDRTGNITISADGVEGAPVVIPITQEKAPYIPVTGISLNYTSYLDYYDKEPVVLVATIIPENASNKKVFWGSSDPSVVSIDSNGKATLHKVGQATVTAITEDGNLTAVCQMNLVQPPTGVTLNKSTLTLVKGKQEQLIKTVEPENVFRPDAVTWTSSDPSVATVDSTGNVTAINIGTADITVKTNDRAKTATCKVTVTDIPVTGVTLNKTSTTINKGSTETLTATVAPSDATNKSVTWSSSNTNVATVDSNGVVTGKVNGNTTITVKTADGGFSAECDLTVVAHIISPTSTSIAVGTTRNITSSVFPDTLSDFTTTWTSSDTSVLTVTPASVNMQRPVVAITGNKAGTAVVTGTTKLGGAACTYTVTVVSTSLNKSTLSLVAEASETLKATVTPAQYNGEINSVTWGSDNTNVATVDSAGKVTAKAAGTANITATSKYGAAKATCKVTVTNKSVTLDKTSSAGGVADGGGTSVSVTANAAWTAKSDSAWLTFNPASGDSGTTKVTVNYAKNTTTAARTGKITFTCGSVTVVYSLTQNKHTISLSATTQTGVSPDGASYTVNVTPSGACAWTAKSDSSWLTLDTTSGTGNGSFKATAAKNSGTAARTATVTVTCGTASTTYKLTQNNYSISLSATSQTGVSPDGASYTIKPTSTANWTAKSDSTWLTIDTASGSSGASVKVTAAKNSTTAARTGKITFTCGTTTATYSLTQNKYSVSLSATSQTGVSPDGASYTIKPTTTAAWTAKSDSAWLTIDTASGSSGASVKVTAAKNNTTADRTGKVTFTCGNVTATYSLTQNKYSVSLSATSQTGVSPDGASYTIKPTTTAAWTAKSDSSWLTIDTASGSSGASVKVTAAKNNTTADRTGKVTFTCGNATATYSLTQNKVTVVQDPINPGLLALSESKYAITKTCDYWKHCTPYSNKEMTTVASGWVGENDTVWILSVGRNNQGKAYAYIKFPIYSDVPDTYAYLPLSDIVPGALTGNARIATNSVYNQFSEWIGNTSYVQGRGVDKNDSVWLLTQSDGWCQILYPAGSLYRIMWCTQSTYDSMFASSQTPSVNTKWLNGVPYWLQGDSRWSGIYIGTKTIGQVGCTTTCLAMTESYRTGTTITPADMRYQLSYSNNDVIWSSASNYHFYGKDVYSYKEVMDDAYEAINNGKPLIIEGTSSGKTHWVVIVGYVDLNTNNMQTSNFMINDPGDSSRTTLADFLNYRGTITSVMSY